MNQWINGSIVLNSLPIDIPRTRLDVADVAEPPAVFRVYPGLSLNRFLYRRVAAGPPSFAFATIADERRQRLDSTNPSAAKPAFEVIEQLTRRYKQ